VGSVEIVGLLLERGASLGVKDLDGWTAMQLAIDDGNIGVISDTFVVGRV
jgi:ankyrin repeat protein